MRLLRLAPLHLAAVAALAQTAGLTVSPAILDFTYQVNDATLPAAKPVQVTAPTSAGGATVTVQALSTPQGWLTATPDTGRPPFTVTVSVNPTGLAPGSYSGTVTVDTVPTSNKPASVTVTLSVRNPPSTLSVTSNAPKPGQLDFDFVTGTAAASPASWLLQVASTGDTIPFTVTAGGGAGAGAVSWVRVNGANQLPSAKTSGVALSGSSVPITVTVDPVALAALSPGSYTNTVTVTGSSKADTTAIVVTLMVSAGPPSVTSVYPAQIVAGPVVNPTLTIYGDNFFNTSVVSLKSTAASPPPPITLTSTLLSRKVLRAVIPAARLTSPGSWVVLVTNPPPPSNPSQAPASYPFNVISATQPAINAIVNSASYLSTAVFAGTGANPVPLGATSVAPRELIAIFGQNLGPSTLTVAQPAGTPAQYPTALAGVSVSFQVLGATVPAPLIMVSSNQINAVVPAAVAAAIGSGTVDITVNNGSATTGAFTARVVDADPGLFTFDGLGKGGAAVLNFDALANVYTINTSKDAAARSSTIMIFATGMGEVAAPLPLDGEVASAAVPLSANTVRVDIDGQPCVVTYAGSTPGSVTGLAQINAIVPPTVRTGAAIPITVSVGTAAAARRSQALVTIATK